MSGDLPDALAHLWDLFVVLPPLIRRARSATPPSFWINLEPRILAEAAYSIDADAVYLPSLRDIIGWFKNKRLSVEETAFDLPELKNCTSYPVAYALIRKTDPK